MNAFITARNFTFAKQGRSERRNHFRLVKEINRHKPIDFLFVCFRLRLWSRLIVFFSQLLNPQLYKWPGATVFVNGHRRPMQMTCKLARAHLSKLHLNLIETAAYFIEIVE